MAIRLGNMPPGLMKLVPEGFKPEDAEMVFVDRKGIEVASTAHAELAEGLRLVDAYNRMLGSETTVLTVADLPEGLQEAGKLISGGADTLTGGQLLKLLEQPTAIHPTIRAAVPELASLLHAQMGKDELMKGLLAQGVPPKRMNSAELTKWFAAAVEELRAAAGDAPIDEAGANKLIKLTKQALLNVGGGLLLRSCLDEAVRELNQAPGLSDAAVTKLATFRKQTQPGRTAHTRTEAGALVKLDIAKRRAEELAPLNAAQKQALSKVNENAGKKVEAARASVLKRIEAWGFGEADLDKLVAYIRSYAPVTIQFHPDKKLPGGQAAIDSFLEDPFYKNQFQTKISSGSLGPSAGSSRDGWEKKIFDGAYHTGPLVPEERPKYGGLSALNSPKGNGGSWYGKCFFELRQDVKFRTTFTPRNSSGCGFDEVSTVDTIEVLLDQIGNKDSDYLRKMFEVARGERTSIDKNYSGSYVEAQVHGDIDLSRDVTFLVIEKSYLSNAYGQKLMQLAEKIGATVKITDQTRFMTEDDK